MQTITRIVFFILGCLAFVWFVACCAIFELIGGTYDGSVCSNKRAP